MKVRITAVTSISDGRGHRYRAGQVVEVDDATAAGWQRHGYAVPLSAPVALVGEQSAEPAKPTKRKRKG